jgi:predicted 3-demethylubiquinone-9 3-methyltransferase (glyoxalase superfamily)
MVEIQKIVPCLWFDERAEEAANFYVSVFDNSRITNVTYYGREGHEIHGRPAGSVMTVAFELDGVELTALNGGPHFKFTEAISLQVMCRTQQEIDRLWRELSSGGDAKARQCGWLKDRFGLSWQIVPTVLPRLLADSDRSKSGRVMRAVLEMDKLDIAELERAAG